MDQSRVLSALEPFLALSKSATSPRAAADLITQATSASNTYIFAELLQQPNIQALSGHEQYGPWYKLLEIFSFGTWDQYKASSDLPELSSVQNEKLRLLSFLTISSQRTSNLQQSRLNYKALMTRLNIDTALELEQLVVKAIYSGLVSATLDPAAQTVVVTSIAPLRDLSPGSITIIIDELSAWSQRCNVVLDELEGEIAKVKEEARKRHLRDARTDKQFRAAVDAAERPLQISGSLKSGDALRSGKRDVAGGDEEENDHMDIDTRDPMALGGNGKKRSADSSAMSRILGRYRSGR